MKVRTLESEQTIARPLEEVFAFFNRPENLGRITPANQPTVRADPSTTTPSITRTSPPFQNALPSPRLPPAKTNW